MRQLSRSSVRSIRVREWVGFSAGAVQGLSNVDNGELSPSLTGSVTCRLHEIGVRRPRVIRRVVGKQGSCRIIEDEIDGRRFVLKSPLSGRLEGVVYETEQEYRALERFYQAAQGHPAVRVPEPLELFQEHSAYLMEFVEGVTIPHLLRADRPRPDVVRPVVDHILSALQLYYGSVQEMYGDFQPANVLVNTTSQVVTLLDPTPYHSIQRILAADMPFSPMSSDLGYWVYGVASRSVKQAVLEPILAARLVTFTRELIRRAGQLQAGDAEAAFSDAVLEVARRYMAHLRSEGHARGRLVSALGESRIERLRPQRERVKQDQAASRCG